MPWPYRKYSREYCRSTVNIHANIYGKNAKAPQAWQANYPEASFQTVNRDNYLDFLSEL